jgi:hypothetical protein
MSCGCNQPRNDHNDYNNITYNSLLKAMVAGNVDTMMQLIENMEDTYDAMQSGSTDSTESADEGVNDDQGPTASY